MCDRVSGAPEHMIGTFSRFTKRLAADLCNVPPIVSVRFAGNGTHVALLAGDSLLRGWTTAVLGVNDFQPNSGMNGNLMTGHTDVAVGQRFEEVA